MINNLKFLKDMLNIRFTFKILSVSHKLRFRKRDMYYLKTTIKSNINHNN